jgi:predicted aldo/keto reductase-like oxidoreductase
MHRYLDQQLKRLDVRQIDFYLAHNLNSFVWETMVECRLGKFFDEAVKDGRIRYPAFSFHDHFSLFEKIVKSYDWAMAQIQYNYLDVEFQAGQAGAKLAKDRGLALVVMEPLRGGFLVNHVPDEAASWMREARPDWSMAAWGLNWLWNQPEVSLVLSGMTAMEQVTENLFLAEKFDREKFGAEEEGVIKRVREYFASRLKTNCTGCGYCMPCPSGVEIPKNLGFLNQYHLFEAKEAQERCRYFYGIQTSPEERADQCSECRQCEEKCPQHIAIPDYLAQMAEVFRVA